MENTIREYAAKYNSPEYFTEDPIVFPKRFVELYKQGKATLQDVEIAGIIAAHLAWGRRKMIVRDCERAFEEMNQRPYEYVMAGKYRSDDTSLHRTVKWSEFARICDNLRNYYLEHDSIEPLTVEQIRAVIYGQKTDRHAANKKINMFRRWMVRNDGIVDFGLWKNVSPKDLIIPLDVHVHRTALELGLSHRFSTDAKTALEITQALLKIFPDDPCLGDFALFGYGVNRGKSPNP